MSTLAYDVLTIPDFGRMIAEALKNKSYRATPVGQLVGRYIRWCRNEAGFVEATTIRDYEGTLARMALTLGMQDPKEVTIEDLRLVIDLWGDKEARTRAKVTSAIRSFWKWAEDEGHVTDSPARRIRRPRLPKPAVELLPNLVDTQLLSVTETPRDRVALMVLLDLGLRRSELTGILVRDFDLSRRTLTVFGKGQKHRVLPVRGRIVLAFEEYLLTDLPFLNRQPEPDDYLVYSEHRNGSGIYKALPKSRMPGQTVHRWWYRHLREAGLVGKGVERGMNMHRARHTFAVELRRTPEADIGTVQHALGHTSPATTEAFYGHYDLSDLERAMEQFSKGRE